MSCTVEGYTPGEGVVISAGGELHCIHPDYLAEMQVGLFRFPIEFVVLDLETTGLSPRRDKIVEFAGVKFRSGVEVDKYSTLVNPRCELSPLAEAVNGINCDMVADAPCIEDVLPEIRAFLGTAPIVAHNAAFDTGFLQTAYDEVYGWKLENKVIDTLKLSRKAYPQLSSHKLSTLRDFLNIEVETAHRALPDVYATAELFVKCVDAINTQKAATDGE